MNERIEDGIRFIAVMVVVFIGLLILHENMPSTQAVRAQWARVHTTNRVR